MAAAFAHPVKLPGVGVFLCEPMSATPIFSGEVQFRRYSDTSTQGASIVLALPDRAELEAFVGKEGKRFMAVLVEIGDDEQPVQQPEPAKPPRSRQTPSQWLAMRCAEPAFWEFLRSLRNVPMVVGSEISAALLVRDILKVASRAECDTDPEAFKRWDELRMQWLDWCTEHN